jgi:alpha-mannosidase
MKMKQGIAIAVSVLFSLSVVLLAPGQQAADDANATCLLVTASCLAKGGGNFYLYQAFSRQGLKIAKGDVLEYREYLEPGNPSQRVAIDIQFDNGNLRDSPVKDMDGLRAHADTVVDAAVGQWHTRSFNLDEVAGRTAAYWAVAFEGDKFGRYVTFIKDVVVRHADGSVSAIYNGGAPAASRTELNSQYSRHVAMRAVPLQSVADEAARAKAIGDALARLDCLSRLDEAAAGLDLAESLLKSQSPAPAELLEDVAKARQTVAGLQSKEDLTKAETDAATAEIGRLLTPVRPFVRQWTGHLVGHAHIDMQWLWEYPETVAEFGKTFSSAVNFLEEFPDFTFTQSSSAFYQETEASHPALFEKIKKYVAEGRWEIVGGRVCEGDTNIMSAESHARQFLYGQRYFRERFGKQAVVGFEPDTFGHTWQMPQILKHGGCKYYYFCRAGNGRGKGFPMYWWSAPDGSRVLTFEESVISGWYCGGAIDKGVFNELAEMTKRTGSKDELWVYGVGNHGGGPTRESIETANEWKKQEYLPTVKFSTAQAFFEAQGKDVLDKLPVVNDELNSVFEGCYTTHGDIKRLNNDSQAVMVSAETAAAVAARFGFNYPGLQIRQLWEDICWNHHHDTIDGSAVHAPYGKSRQMLEKVIASGRGIGQEAVSFLAAKSAAHKGELLIFNPLGFDRDAVVDIQLPEGVKSESLRCGDDACPVQVTDAKDRRALVAVHKLPSVGYATFGAASPGSSPAAPSVSEDGTVLENENLKVVLDPATGTIRSLFDKRLKREFVASGKSANRMEIHYERPNGMPAWDIGAIDRVEPQDCPVTLSVVERGPVRCTVEFSRKMLASIVTQRVSLIAGGDSVVCSLAIDWKETGNMHPQWPFLKVAFDLAVENGRTTYETPFGAIERPADGHENAALKWFDLSGPGDGVSIINDTKHGCSVKDGTMRLSLVRTPTNPDNTSDNYMQTVRYEIYPHQGGWEEAGIINRAFAFVHPLFAVWLEKDGTGELPGRCSFVKPADGRAVVTAIKRAEDDDDLVVRLYNPGGASIASSLDTWWPVEGGKQVNFMEDAYPAPVPCSGKSAGLQLNGHEIQTLKLSLQGSSAPMQGTRGPTPVRPF